MRSLLLLSPQNTVARPVSFLTLACSLMAGISIRKVLSTKKYISAIGIFAMADSQELDSLGVVELKSYPPVAGNSKREKSCKRTA